MTHEKLRRKGWAIILSATLGAITSCGLPENRGREIPRLPELLNRRAYSVNTGSVNLATKDAPLEGFLSTPATPYPSPGILFLPTESGVTKEVELEAQRLAAGGYVVLVVPPPTETDPRARTAAWSDRLQRAVRILQGANETRDRSLCAVGYGEGAARALQLSLIEPAVQTAVAWNPPAISGGAKLDNVNASWLIINPPSNFQEPSFLDWTALNGIKVTQITSSEEPATFGTPGDPSYFSAKADEARLRQQLFLVEQVGSVDAPALLELEKPTNKQP